MNPLRKDNITTTYIYNSIFVCLLIFSAISVQSQWNFAPTKTVVQNFIVIGKLFEIQQDNLHTKWWKKTIQLTDQCLYSMWYTVYLYLYKKIPSLNRQFYMSTSHLQHTRCILIHHQFPIVPLVLYLHTDPMYHTNTGMEYEVLMESILISPTKPYRSNSKFDRYRVV